MNENAYVEPEGILYLLIGLFFILSLLFVGFTFVNPLWSQEHNKNITVIEKIPYHDGHYLVVTERKYGEINITEVFSVSDEYILVTFDASDRYAHLKEGKTYSVDVCGYRYQPLSMYRNIYKIHGDYGIEY
jgi:hypothetical protein